MTGPRIDTSDEAYARWKAGTPAVDTSDEAFKAWKGEQPSKGAALAPLAQGLTLGFADEALGAVEGLNRKIKGGSFTEGYREGRDKVRAGTARFAADNPKTSFALTLAGGIAPGIAGAGGLVAKAGAGLAKRIAATAAEGAAFGGVSGLGSAEGSAGEQLGQTAVGAALGGAIGGAIPVLGAAGRGVKNAIGRKGASASRQADALLARALERDNIKPSDLANHGATFTGKNAPRRADPFLAGTKVVDDAGEPLTVYHGTRAGPFDTFKVGRAEGWGDGIYFTDNATQAADEFAGGPTGRVVKAHVSIKKPYTGDEPLDLENTRAWKEISDQWDTPEDAWQEDRKFVSKVLRERGFDGIIAKNSNNIDGREIVAFRPEQIRMLNEAAEASTGKPAILADLAGENVLGLARGAQATPSKAKESLAEMLHRRQAGQSKRVAGDVEGALGMQRQNVHDVAENLIKTRRENAQPLYEAAYAKGSVDDPAILETLNLPQFKIAYGRARRIAKLEGVDLPPLNGSAAAAVPAAEVAETVPGLVRARTPGGRLKTMRTATDDELAGEYATLVDANAVENIAPSSIENTNSGLTQWVGMKGGAMKAAGRIAQRKKSLAKVEEELSRRGINPDDAYWMAKPGEGGESAALADEGAGVLSGDDSFDFGANVPAPKSQGIPIQAIDYVKRSLDDVIQGGMSRGSIGKTEARALRNRLADMLAKVDEKVPEYKAARQQFAGDAALSDALESGRTFLKDDARLTEKALAAMTDGEREMYKVGALDAVRQAMDKTADGRDMVKQVFGSTAKRDQLKALIGDDTQFAALEQQLERESRMVRTKDRVLGGSPTARIQTELQELGEGGIAGVAADVITSGPRAVAMRAIANAMRRGQGNHGEVADVLAQRMALEPGTPEFAALIKQLGLSTQQAATVQTPARLLGSGARRALSAGAGRRSEP